MVLLLMNIIVRIIFTRVLSKEYLGLSGLFGNIISLLSLAELGIGTAIVYSLYAPLAYRQEEEIRSLMKFYQRVYIIIGLIILTAGAALTPYLHFFIREMPDIPEIRQIYLLFVFNAAASYFFSYKSSLISADQKDYVVKQIKLLTTLAMVLLQITILYTTKNYLLYLWVQIGATISHNLICMRIANRMYPFIQDAAPSRLSRQTLGEITKNTKAMIYHKLGEVVLVSTDNLIISKFVGLVAVGLYSNYTLIQQALTSILSQIFTAMTASVVNLKITEGTEKRYEIFKKVFFLNAWIYGFCSISFLCLAQDFIRIFFGNSFVLDTGVLVLIVFCFYLEGMRKTTLTFRDAFGLFWHNRYMPIGEASLNLLISFVLVGKYGIKGVLIGTSVSILAMPWWIEPYIVFRHGLMTPVKSYWKAYGIYTFLSLLTAFITWKACEHIQINFPVLRLGIKVCLCGLIPNIFYWIFFRRQEEYQYYLKLFHNIREAIMEKKWIKEAVDWAAAAIIVLSLCLFYISKPYYDRLISFAPMINLIPLSLLFFNHIDWIESLKSKDKELIFLILGVVISMVNLVLAHSGYGAIFNITDFLLIIYLSDKIPFNRHIYSVIGAVCFLILGTWIGKGAKSYNTNLASMILFAISVYAVTALMAVMKRFGKELWGKGISFFLMLGLILPMVIKLHARCVALGIAVFLIVNYLIPSAAWKCRWLYRTCVGLLLSGSILFPIWYIKQSHAATTTIRVFGKKFFSGRDPIWEQFLTAFCKEPLTGIGSDFATKMPNLTIPEAHNGLLHILTVHGILVFAIVIFFLGKRLFQIQKTAFDNRLTRQCAAAIIALATVSIFENYFVFSFYNIFVLLLFNLGIKEQIE